MHLGSIYGAVNPLPDRSKPTDTHGVRDGVPSLGPFPIHRPQTCIPSIRPGVRRDGGTTAQSTHPIVDPPGVRRFRAPNAPDPIRFLQLVKRPTPAVTVDADTVVRT